MHKRQPQALKKRLKPSINDKKYFTEYNDIITYFIANLNAYLIANLNAHEAGVCNAHEATASQCH